MLYPWRNTPPTTKTLSTASDEWNAESLSEDDLPDFKTKPVVPLIIDSTLNDTSQHVGLICPKWESYDKRLQLQKDFSENCTTLASLSPDFSIKLCESPRFCGQGYFLVSRTNKTTCTTLLQTNISHNPVTNRYLKETVGSDAFQVTFNGPQRETPALWKHLGSCEYKLPFRLTNPGRYTVALVHTYDGFKAVDEVVEDVWPRPVYTHLLGKGFEVDVCTGCPVYTAAGLAKDGGVRVCGRRETLKGVYLRMTNETERERVRFKMYGVPYIWEPLGCRLDQTFELNANKSCHGRTPRKILGIGDSQVRLLMWALNRRLSGSRVPMNQTSRTYMELRASHKGASKTGGTDLVVIPHEHLDVFIDVIGYRWFDAKLKATGTEKLLLPFDTVVFTLAHWPSSGVEMGGHFSLERYVDLIEHIANSMERINQRRVLVHKKKPIHFIWMGVNAFTIKAEGKESLYDAQRIDWRTNYRLKVWSEYAERVFRRKGMSIMNSFDATLPWAQNSIDGGHFHGTPAMDAQVDELLHKLNICNVEDD
ncbi:hypothetical protein BCR33DRAFT_856901 [Rhizoclosmatium globosum]|uniref:Uncharacterized protein n=1 Tax=Rhizoclosmatium globosum TaxID=329046 RepID=A0A1Y2B9U3_9FUNG|nr:hypothetical protein BCR33DRAFT_856901 [Rhizoclosmatium globosum]|eukprot:ORY31534.1 hypothetical protein BCR33DRAFT_856901 [Rhizoclosmatium globosum]